MSTIYLATGGGFDWLNAANSLIGVLLGAALTFFVTSKFEAGRTKEAQLGRAYALIFGLQHMTDDLLKLERQIHTARLRATSANVEGPLWTILEDIVGFSRSDISISPDELAIVAVTKDVELLLDVREVEAAHRIYIDAIQKLWDLRERLEGLGLETAVEGQTVSFEATGDNIPKIAPTLIRLNTLSESIEGGLPRAVQNAKSVCERLGPHLKKHFKFKHFITMTLPDASDAEV